MSCRSYQFGKKELCPLRSSNGVRTSRCHTLSILFAELLRYGYSDEAIKKIAGINFLRAMRQMEQVAE